MEFKVTETAFCPVLVFHLELSANAVDEELPAVFPRIHQSGGADLWPHAADDVLHLVVWEQVRNLSFKGQNDQMTLNLSRNNDRKRMKKSGI